jgi:hypothetical protein
MQSATQAMQIEDCTLSPGFCFVVLSFACLKVFVILFALMQIGNPPGLRKKNQARPDAPPGGQANAHEQSL